MEHARELLSNPNVLSVIALVVGALWAWFKKTELGQRAFELDRVDAIEAVEAAVERTYLNYVNGKGGVSLSSSEKVEARRKAVGALPSIIRQKGKSPEKLMSILGGTDGVHAEIAKAVRRVKGKGFDRLF